MIVDLSMLIGSLAIISLGIYLLNHKNIQENLKNFMMLLGVALVLLGVAVIIIVITV